MAAKPVVARRLSLLAVSALMVNILSVLGILFGLVMFGRSYQRWMERQSYLTQFTTGQVTAKDSHKGRYDDEYYDDEYEVAYTYLHPRRDQTFREVEQRVLVDRRVFETLNVGDTVAIVYSSDDAPYGDSNIVGNTYREDYYTEGFILCLSILPVFLLFVFFVWRNLWIE